MSEQARKEFEAWMASQRNGLLKYSTMYSTARRGKGYVDSITNMLWESWQAARRTEPERKVEPWIPVSERLPEPHEIIRFYPPINEGTAYSVDWGWFEGGKCLYQEYDDRHGSLTRVHVHVTHWQPITEPEESGHE